MIVVVDIETYEKREDGAYYPVLDPTIFFCASVVREDGIKKVFWKKEEVWQYLLKLAERERKRKRILKIYSHNANYDFYGYANLEDKGLKWFSNRPFIVSLYKNEKEYIKFLDTFSLFRTNLRNIGHIVELPKLNLPKKIIEIQKKGIEPYVTRDSEIALKAINMLKEKLRKDGVEMRHLMTISQIAIRYTTNLILKSGKYKELFYNPKKGWIKWTSYSENIHKAYRGGRVQCWNIGEFEQVDYIDCNNLYGYASMNIKFPNPHTEKKIKKPLEVCSAERLFNKIGISKVIIKNVSDDIGILQVRVEERIEEQQVKLNYYPTAGKVIIGHYTHIELKEALKNGYELIDVEYSIIWDEMDNPFKMVTPLLYKLRKESNSPFDDVFYKAMMNNAYGKLAENKDNIEMSVQNIEEKVPKGAERVERSGYLDVIKVTKKRKLPKNHYNPIIPALINAKARVYMYGMYKRINKKDLIYTDTDSIIMKKGNLKKYEIDKGIGKFKVEHNGARFLIYGNKTYMINGTIKASGFRNRDTTPEEFKKGEVVNQKQYTMFSTKKKDLLGKIYKERRNLIKQKKNYEVVQKVLNDRKVYIDARVYNINEFVVHLKNV